MTPKQLRELAQRNEFTARGPGLNLESAVALRAAADQLEAVQAWRTEMYAPPAQVSSVRALFALDAILTADTAPQHPCDRDGHDDYCGACATCGRTVADTAPQDVR